MDIIERVIRIAKQEEGYLEKASNKDLDSRTANAGNKNYTKYWRDIREWGLGNYQGQYWCAGFIFWCFVKAYGLETAKKLLLHAPYISCGTLAAKSRAAGQLYDTPQKGDVPVFWNGSRFSHTGLVCQISGGYFYTAEGNTSGASGVVSNGGGVVVGKRYPIAGTPHRFHRPDWSLAEKQSYTTGWHKDQNGWWYADTERTYLKQCWQVINGHKYYFNQDGYAVTGWQEIDGKWYYFEPRAGHPLECALYRSDQEGAQDVGSF